jgi:hypothetical protein
MELELIKRSILEIRGKKVILDFELAKTDSDVLGDAYEYLIGQFASGAGKKAGEAEGERFPGLPRAGTAVFSTTTRGGPTLATEEVSRLVDRITANWKNEIGRAHV